MIKLTPIDSSEILWISPSCIQAIQVHLVQKFTGVYCTSGDRWYVRETAEEILALIPPGNT